jgi:3-oxoacyl-[acyl-carrier protein] reductase
MGELKNKVALVTGGARGIGKAIVLELASQGAHIVISDIDEMGAKKTADEAKALGIQSISIKADVSSSQDVESLIKTVLEQFGKIDILVNNAGITRDNLLMRMSEDEWDTVLRINLKGTFLCTKAVIRPMMKNRYGKIINISSVVGVMGNAGQSNYSASKAGLIGFTKSVAKEVGAKGIQVNAVAPGFIETEMTNVLSDDIKEAYYSVIPAKRAGTVIDVAKVVSFLASPGSDYITGQVIHIDGGMVM